MRPPLPIAAALVLAAAASCSDKNGSTRGADPGTRQPEAPLANERPPADPGPGAPVGAITPGQIAGGTTSEAGIIAQIRPLVYNAHGADPLQIAVHFQRDNGPIGQDEPRRDLDRVATVASLTIHLTMPNGSRHELSADTRDVLGQKRYDYGLYFAPTLILTIGPDGLSEIGGIAGPWKGTAPAWSSGTFDVAVSGRLALADGTGIDFETEAVTIATGVEDVLPRDELLARAKEIYAARVPSANPVGGYLYNGTDAGFAADLVLEILEGQRVVRFAQTSEAFSIELHSVVLDPAGNEIAVNRQSVKTCVAEGTPIATPEGDVPVESLRPGDAVWAYDTDRGRHVAATVRGVREGVRADTIWLTDTLRITPDHPVYADGAWRPAGEVTEGAEVITMDGARPARAYRAAGGPVRVFDLTVDGPHDFFAGGLLVHNKDRNYWPDLDDPWFFMWEPRR